MCNLYAMMSNQEAIRAFSKYLAIANSAGNLPPFSAIESNDFGPIVRNTPHGRELAMARWGMPTNPFYLKGKRVDAGVTNVRNLDSGHWRPWLGVENRCVVPFTSFTEFDQVSKVDVWYASDVERPLQFFAGIWLGDWTSVRKMREGPTTSDLYAFLTTKPGDDMKNAKAVPVILRTPEEVDTWLGAPIDEALRFQEDQPFPAGTLGVLGRGGKTDGDGVVAKTYMSATPVLQPPPAQGNLF